MKDNGKYVKEYIRMSYKYLGKFVEDNVESYFSDIHDDLKKIGFKLTLSEYLSMALMTSLIVFVIQVPLLSIIFTITFLSRGLGVAIVGGLLLGFIGGLISGILIFFLFYVYPRFVIDEYKKQIGNELPFATLYLATMAGTGMTLLAMFKTLSKFKEFKIVSKESYKIVEDTEIIGNNIIDAISKIANRTNSEQFKELLWGIRSTIMVGGDLRSYLHEKSISYMQDYKRNLSKFTQQLSLMIEIYITLVIVGSIFFLILTTILANIGTISPSTIVLMQFVIVILIFPLVSAGFIILFKGMSPE